MDARKIADYILSKINTEAGDSITNLKLQKVLYYTQGWALAVLGKPLFDEEIEAWKYGPVVPSIYHAFKMFGDGAILPTRDLAPLTSDISIEIISLIDQVWDRYGEMSGVALMKKTHRETPWLDAYDCDVSSKPISKADMRAYFLCEQESLIRESGLGPPDMETAQSIEKTLAAHA
ncbi:MAG: SocA family protein [Magnetospirillum sp.]|nr:SocA family protein [Magnetospirillum sp.]MBI3708019.1 SocA family protein [Pseudomonadota bacterium]